MKVGFIGTGNMGGALATAASKQDNVELILANKPTEVAQALADKIGGIVTDNTTLVKDADYIFVGVKPQNLNELGLEIKSAIDGRDSQPVIVTMLAGTAIAKVEAALGQLPIIRIMPNVAAMVGESMIMYSTNDAVTEEQLNDFLAIMSEAGLCAKINENQMSAGAGVAGCGPAFAAMFIEALADGGVACGLTRQQAIQFAAQMAKGTAQYILETGIHPGALKDSVTSPGGTTIQGVRALEKGGFRSALFEAVVATVEKDQSL